MYPRFLVVGLFALLIAGCNPPHPGVWELPKVESHIKQAMELTELKLEPSGAGAFTGTGKSADGESFKLKIKQDVAGKRLSWEYKGDRGTIGDEKYEFVQ